jgi:hypothetical protein
VDHRQHTDAIAGREALDPRSELLDDADPFVPDQARQLRGDGVAARPVHRLGPIEAHCFHANANFTGARFANLPFFDLQHLRPTEGVNAYDFGHKVSSPPWWGGWGGLTAVV